MPTKITKGKYWDKSWNPLMVKGRGWHCTKTSAGCLHCWAEQQNLRFGNKLPYDNRPVEYVLNEKILQQPLNRKIPTTYFACDLCDLFHEAVPDDYIYQMFNIIRQSQHHIYLILTKRIRRLLSIYKKYPARAWPISKNLYLGVSISTPDEIWKIEELAKIPAVIRFVSFEPLLADLGDIMPYLVSLDWVIIGCESINGRVGRGADYFRCNAIKIVRQCKSAGVPVFVKQVPVAGKTAEQHRLSRKMAEWPEELRVQERPGG